MRCLRAHGWTRNLKNGREIEARYPEIHPSFLFVNMGYNLRPTLINAAFGRIQLRKLDAFNQRRKEIMAEWTERLAPLCRDGILSPMRATPGVDPAFFGFRWFAATARRSAA